MIVIKPIKAINTIAIRHEVMWPNKPQAYVVLPNDNEGLHFGLFLNQTLVSVVSLFTEENTLQFRKFATLQAHQGKGYGSQLLTHVFEYANKKHYKKIWCNARKDKTTFYERFGLKETSETFVKGGITYVIMTRNF
ncbi:GNAT family N-acetyltransferase [Seonamhaeicola algicola]|uniref:GNAT family N-acetyltransferase n=1 Tax=Seonamhaeicola algicola TaxID=1719036 RepID=A0A5C7AC55_9FLAO|nr:GNAT family N-acetyltransferase [Seonamhaeicola algicola]TXE06148.1 GNAT family N-acetyltransferase [Seonamhaeicola algicola]